MTKPKPIDTTTIWSALEEHQSSLRSCQLKDLFANEVERGSRFSAEAAGIYFDYSKCHITETTLNLFDQLTEHLRLAQHIEALFRGDLVNRSEGRPALHTALRETFRKHHEQSDPLPNKTIRDEIDQSLNQTFQLADQLRTGSISGSTGEVITDVVHLGIGGSALGPQLVAQALAGQFAPIPGSKLRLHFVDNIDSDTIDTALQSCKPASTLFIISSKSFTTLETLSNSDYARQWLSAGGIDDKLLHAHFVAITSHRQRALEWGVEPRRILTIGEWVGGRYSLWSAMGLPAVIAIGSEAFKEMLVGAAAMDDHFQNTPWRQNLPILHGLISIWHINFWHYKSRAILPYVHKLRKLPDYLQQLITESLGKSVDQAGDFLKLSTAQAIWGGEETNGQHSFHQMLLQGTDPVPVDFLITRKPHCEASRHRQLYANCLAQSQALMMGTGEAQLPSHSMLGGNRPSNTLVLDRLSPACLGALLALYEHSVYIQSLVWNINAFDQWGVEQGKQLSKTIFHDLSAKTGANRLPRQETDIQIENSSTSALVKHYRK